MTCGTAGGGEMSPYLYDLTYSFDIVHLIGDDSGLLHVLFMSTSACLPSCLAMWVPRRCVFLLDTTGHIPNVEVVCIAHVSLRTV